MKTNIAAYIGRERCKLKSSLSRRLIGLALVCAPKLSMRIFERVIPLILATFLCEIDYPIKCLGLLASCIPSRRSLYKLMDSFTADIMVLTAHDIKGNNVSLMCDKGES